MLPLPPLQSRHGWLSARFGRMGAVALAGAVLLQGPSVALGEHGGREVGSVLVCDRPVTPPRCTSVGDSFRHLVAFDPSLTDELAAALRSAMETVYEPTRLTMVQQDRVTPLTDVIAFSADYGENGAAGWVFCPVGAPQGLNAAGDRWCRHQELHLNVNARYGLFFDDEASRAHIACHELGHTLGLRHWGNPPQTDGPVGATCMNANTPNGPTSLHPTDVDHINDYRYWVRPRPRGLEISRNPDADAGAAATGSMVEASQVETPSSVAELVATADAVVLGRVIDVEPGRVFGSDSYALHYAAVSIRVAEVLAGGGIGTAGVLTLEIPLFAGPATHDALRAEQLGTTRLLFLRNKGTSAAEAGLSAAERRAESAYFRLVTFGSEVVDVNGLASVPPDDAAVLDSFSGRPFASVLADVRALAP